MLRLIIQMIFTLMYGGYVISCTWKMYGVWIVYKWRDNWAITDPKSSQHGKPNPLIDSAVANFISSRRSYIWRVSFVGLQILMLYFGGFYDELTIWLKVMLIGK